MAENDTKTPEPIADPQPPVDDGQDLADVSVEDIQRNPSPVLVDESKPHYIGTENAPEPFKPQVQVVDSGLSGTTPEVHVVMDQVVPGEVYVPDEGIGSLELPIHGLVGGKTVQQQLDEANSAEITDEDRVTAASEGRSSQTVANDRENS